MPIDNRYWFPAKRYGWGWGFPITWQGWAAFGAFIGLLIAGLVFVPPKYSLAGFLAYAIALSVLFAGVCWWKGEPARWRWGDQ
jgi:hypothetical protein